MSLSADERELLRGLPAQLRTLLNDTSDPDLRRLFPPAHAEDAELEQEYRRLVHDDLLSGHRASLEVMEATVDAKRLDEAQLNAWMGAINDMRLVLGTRLNVTEDQKPLDPDDPRSPAMALYGYLSWLQEQVVEALAGGL
ncbi:MAG TPA: DUF2017 family protein [Acidimicrobiales bacterium]|nr:DUF2017 family protein [Acidimicrobiales bacterium]